MYITCMSILHLLLNEYGLYSKYDRLNMSTRVIFQANVYILCTLLHCK